MALIQSVLHNKMKKISSFSSVPCRNQWSRRWRGISSCSVVFPGWPWPSRSYLRQNKITVACGHCVAVVSLWQKEVISVHVSWNVQCSCSAGHTIVMLLWWGRQSCAALVQCALSCCRMNWTWRVAKLLQIFACPLINMNSYKICLPFAAAGKNWYPVANVLGYILSGLCRVRLPALCTLTLGSFQNADMLFVRLGFLISSILSETFCCMFLSE